MKHIALLLTSVIIFYSCKTKEKEEEKRYVSITSLLKKEIEHVDTSLYSIIKIVSTDTAHIDTTYIPREKFAEEAKEFLEIPDFSDPKIAKRFKEENRYDSLMDRIILTYSPVDKTGEEVNKVELLVSTDIMSDGNNKITNIIIEKGKTDRNGAYSTQMLWNLGKNFLITHSTQKPAEAEKTTVTKVIWNDDTFR